MRTAASLSSGLALLGVVLAAGLLVLLAAGPVATADLWWHLKTGEFYLAEGPWPDADPMLHTAHADAPVQHEWLFSIATHLVQRVAGFHGLRFVHALAVAGILLLVYRVFQREADSRETACLATVAFAVLAGYRLVQLRADLLSIPATLGIFALLIAPTAAAPSLRRVAMATGLFLVWANAHPLFAIALILLAGALLGLAARALLAAWLPPDECAAIRAVDRGRARRLGIALVAGFGASLLNPRGLGQHLTFSTASRTSGIWTLRDEWSPFHPFDWRGYGDALTVPAGVLVDLLLVALPLAAVVGCVRFWRRPTRDALEAIDPVRYALGFAGLCALLVSIRFFWMGAFALLCLLRTGRILAARHGGASAGLRLGAAAAALGLALVQGARELGGGSAVWLARPDRWLSTPYLTSGYHAAGVRFLRDAGLEGNLFNAYVEGGFLGYWLAPRLRTFVDGRTDHFPAEVMEEYYDVKGLRPRTDGRSFLDLLERRRVDVFFGVGLPIVRPTRWYDYTSAHLQGVPGWILVFRTPDQAIYLRADERNRDNLRRVAAYYAERDIPFDPERGLDVAAAIAARPDWARTLQVIPVDYARLEAARAGDDPELRFRALDQLARLHALLGEHARALELDREALALRPDALAPQRRAIWSLLWLGRSREAASAARTLRRKQPDDPLARAYEQAARLLAGPAPLAPDERRRILLRLPLLDWQEAYGALGGRFVDVRPEAAPEARDSQSAPSGPTSEVARCAARRGSTALRNTAQAAR